MSSAMRVGGTGCEATEWASESNVRCQTSSVIAATMRIGLTTGQQLGTITEVVGLSISGGVVSGLTVSNRARTGSASLTMHGGGFGAWVSSGKGRTGQTSCEASGWWSDTTVQCMVAGSTGMSGRVGVTVGAVSGSGTRAMSMDVGSVSGTQRGNVGGTGSTSITLFGAGFGFASFSGGARTGSSSCESSEWTSQTSVSGFISQGRVSSRSIALTVSSFGGSASYAMSFDGSSVSAALRVNTGRTGSTSFTVFGSAMFLHGGSVATRFGGTASEASQWSSESSIVARMARGSGASVHAFISVGRDLGSFSKLVSYDIPRATDGARQNVAGT
eukprot:3546419-Rhodomonas_salina.1